MNIIHLKPVVENKYNKDMFIIKNGVIVFHNFSGYDRNGNNPNGSRTVNIKLDEDDKAYLEGLGYPVNVWTNRSTGEDVYSTRINIKMLPGNTATIRMHEGDNPDYILATAETLGELDGARIFKIDVVWTFSFNKRSNCWVAYLSEADVYTVPSLLGDNVSSFYRQV